MSDISWTEQVVESLKTLWAAGDSASQIADDISRHFGVYCTRSAVIGKVHRLGLPGRKTLPKQGAPKRTSKLYPDRVFKPYRTGERKPPLDLFNYQSPTVEVVPLRLSLFELTATTCRYPYGEPGDKDFFFCGLPTGNDCGSYCRAHFRLTHGKYIPEKTDANLAALKRRSLPTTIVLASDSFNPIDRDERGEAA